MQNKTKDIITGFIIGLIANVVGCFLYILIFSDFGVQHTLNVMIREGMLGGIIALGAVLNLVAFFLFLKKDMVFKARGVLIATFVAAIIIVISKFY